MAIGIACAGTCLSSAYKILEPLLNDSFYLVRQAAYIACGMIFSQANPSSDKNVEKFNEELNKVLLDKEEHVLVRFGACISQGINNLGGRNCIISLSS
jgi:26S proteasome regulatory subunit N2